eukprot:TRINITY_DN2202_c0_g2_i2.p1 TRINITY_DN2202_c0_g2~~TRINITY_DN2202_c0_g2_i2.p1  ORF type:complete len:184 (-),score=55.76 TRINITY_DN2202_c0_g2_i2:347-898(-)
MTSASRAMSLLARSDEEQRRLAQLASRTEFPIPSDLADDDRVENAVADDRHNTGDINQQDASNTACCESGGNVLEGGDDNGTGNGNVEEGDGDEDEAYDEFGFDTEDAWNPGGISDQEEGYAPRCTCRDDGDDDDEDESRLLPIVSVDDAEDEIVQPGSDLDWWQPDGMDNCEEGYAPDCKCD